ncbi:hypothetical protein EJ05DRAFT_511370 [Pseudovirgaria hyperparasitica]|uniref:Vacuolar protein sorting-associated protein 62 n=1 Tax=Pseudovirgaria hyperparasitica TaxID=470096 RepID=A0A6A6W6J7_9PEZI|nr:uncharacterized protein EJ05DRAFT_511370 [Pseudovirgaria hyperparasitica]KAF2757580.1 hypothetical protein EJ05DRAFT_511370 [Pseudovirgaria hyperparasitica]
MVLQALVVVSAILSLASASPVKRKDAIPQFVLDYAPLVYLHSQDPYRPSDLMDTIRNTKPEVNFSVVNSGPLDLNNLDTLNNLGGENVYLTSNEDVTKNPTWLNGITPNANGETENGKTSVILTIDRGNNQLDAYYFYYYAFNWGGLVLGHLNLGNHVGDWEHNMIRFQDGKPTQVWYSQHASGQAFTWDALSKEGQRILAFSGNGSHAVYSREGESAHTIPGTSFPWQGVLTDYTDKGPKWDPTKAAYFYKYDLASQVFTPYESSSPVAYLNYNGRWGDQEYPEDDPRQFNLFGNPRYSSGPNGPKFKSLDRKKICPGDPCIVMPFIAKRDFEER